LYDNITAGVGTGTSIGFAVAAAVPNDSQQNNEALTFWRCSSIGTGFANGTGFAAWSPNCRSLALYEHESANTNIAFTMGASSWHVIGGLTEMHTIALNLDHTGMGTYALVHDEGSLQGVLTHVGGNPTHLTLLNNKYEMNLPDLSKYFWDLSFGGTAVLTIGNFLAPNANVTKIVAPPVHTTWVSIADVWPNNTLANLPDLFNSIASAGAPNVLDPSAIMIGTPNQFTAGIAVVGANGVWIAASHAALNSVNNSPPLTVSAAYDVSGVGHIVPIKFVATMSDNSGTSPVVWQLQSSVDPLSSTTYSGAINMDFGTNSNGGTTTVNQLIIQASSSPTSAGTAGKTGQLAWDSGHLYVCTAGGVAGSATWKAATLSAV
jgi:hypothetical protein